MIRKKQGENMEAFLQTVVPPTVILIELLGVVIIIIGVGKAVYHLFQNQFNFRNEDLIIEIASALSLSLEFILAAEILMTLVVSDMQQLLLLGVLLILRIIITFVLHWELNHIEENQRREREREAL